MAAGLNFDVLAQRAAGIPVPYSYALGPTPGTPATGAAGIGTVAPVAGGGSLAGTYSPYYGGIPQAPSMQQAQSGAMAANLANFPAAQQMASQADASRWQSYTSRFPNYGPLTQQESQNFGYMLSGGDMNVPASVQAAKNLYGGYSGSGFGSNTMGRAVEEYALKNMALGTNLLTQAVGRGQAVPTTDINAYSVSPAQNYSAMLQQAVYGAAPIPSYAAYAAQQAALQGLMLGRQSGAGTAPTQTPTTTPTNDNLAQLTNILSRYLNQGQQGLPQQTTVQQAGQAMPYNPGYDYAAGTWSTPYMDQGVVQGSFEGTGEGATAIQASNPWASPTNESYYPSDQYWDALGQMSGYGFTGPEMQDWYYDY